MLNKIKKMFGMRHEIDSKIFRKSLAQYPYANDVSGQYLSRITSCRAFRNQGKVEVVIRTHLPGFFIGKQGSQISAIRNFMGRKFGEEIEITLVEEDMFDHLYD